MNPSGYLEIRQGQAGMGGPAMHVRLEVVEGIYCLTDLGGANLMRVNGAALKANVPYILRPGDVIRVEELSFTWHAAEGDGLYQDALAAAPVPVGPLPQHRITLEVTTGQGRQVFPLEGEIITVGRARENDLVIEASGVSRRHARLERVGTGYRILDAGSVNGIRYGDRLVKDQLLADGDVLWIAQGVSLVYRVQAGPAETPPAGGGEPGSAHPTVLVLKTAASGTAVLAGPTAQVIPVPGAAAAAATAEVRPAEGTDPEEAGRSAPPATQVIRKPEPGETGVARPDSSAGLAATVVAPRGADGTVQPGEVPSHPVLDGARAVPTVEAPVAPEPDPTVVLARPAPAAPTAGGGPTPTIRAPRETASGAEALAPTLDLPAGSPATGGELPGATLRVTQGPAPAAAGPLAPVSIQPGSVPAGTLPLAWETAPGIVSAAVGGPLAATEQIENEPGLSTVAASIPTVSLPGGLTETGAVEAGVPPASHVGAELEPGAAESALDRQPAAPALTLSEAQVPHLVVHLPASTWEVPLLKERMTIGRTEDNDLVIAHSSVSRCHAVIEQHGSGFIFRDERSTNGVWLGDRRITERRLEDGDTLRIGRAQLVFKAGFRLDDLTLVGASRGKSSRRPVVVVPGIMGSELWLGSERLWPNPAHLLAHPELARYPGDARIQARALVSEVILVPGVVKLEQYNRLGDYLETGLGYTRGVDLLEFPYDWRQDVRQSARQLAEVIESWRAPRPVTIVAHSMGSLVSRYYVEILGGKQRVERLVLLGGPHYGSPKALDTILNGPDLLPFGLGAERLRKLIATFPSMYQLLPSYACITDQDGRRVNLLGDDRWLPEAQRPLLKYARSFRRELGPGSSVPAVSIFGYGQKTITQVRVQRAADGRWERVEFGEELGGDLTVPAASAVLQRSEIHPVPQAHGSLYVDNDVKMRLKVELTRATTWQRS